MPTMQDARAALKERFGYDDFRPNQRDLVEQVLAGRDVLGVMPTGAGKSVVYQIPALLLPGLTLVVSPLISLMKDQVAGLEQAGIPAACVNSTQSADEQARAFSRALSGDVKLLYVAPERLSTPRMAELAQVARISLVAVDEAHCVSQWGQDFRPDYRAIAGFVEGLPARPAVAALTATPSCSWAVSTGRTSTSGWSAPSRATRTARSCVSSRPVPQSVIVQVKWGRPARRASCTAPHARPWSTSASCCGRRVLPPRAITRAFPLRSAMPTRRSSSTTGQT